MAYSHSVPPANWRWAKRFFFGWNRLHSSRFTLATGSKCGYKLTCHILIHKKWAIIVPFLRTKSSIYETEPRPVTK